MDFLSGLAKSASGGDSKKPDAVDDKSSTTEIFADAKVVAEAARAQFNSQPEKCDKTKAADSAADLLDAASDYGKLDETKGAGKYLDQAEGYLRQYSGPKSTPAAAAEDKPAPTSTPAAAEDKPAPTPAPVEDKPQSEGGYGDLMKAAGGFFK